MIYFFMKGLCSRFDKRPAGLKFAGLVFQSKTVSTKYKLQTKNTETNDLNVGLVVV